MPGLAAPVEIRVDRWGLAHIRAQNKADVFFAQGFNAARDRLWQIDLWRKRGLGRLAADFGPGYLEQDVASRAFLYRGDMAREWTSYAPDAREICEAFAAGVNAYVDLVEREPERLPVEFALLGSRPARWRAEDVVRIRSHALTRNALSEVLRARVTAAAGAKADSLRKFLEPEIEAGNPGGLDLATIPLAALDMFKLATTSVSFSAERLAAGLDEAARWRRVDEAGEVLLAAALEGSNNWAVSGARTATGRPIMASDPHRLHGAPSLRYLVHLQAPGLDVIGAGEPSMPGVALGHNGTAAFSLTIFGADQEDVYVYETHPDDPGLYRDGEGWRRFESVTESFAVRGEAEQRREIEFTRHGPVVHREPQARRAYAIRSVWFEPGTGAYLGALSTMRAKSYPEFREAVRRFKAPSLNHLYADVTGAIGWVPFGLTPIRRNWDGLLPVPGDGRFEWDGFMALEDMPEMVDPERGWVASANERNAPTPPDGVEIGYEWLEASRARRIAEVLSRPAPHALADSAALQTDVASLPARRLRALIQDLESEDPDFLAARSLLLGWNERVEAGSAAAALSEVWFTKRLKPALFAAFVPDPATRALLAPGDVEGLLRALEAPERLGAARDGLLTKSLAAAYRDLVAKLGADPAGWRWGDLHHGYFEHALSRVAPAETARLDAGPYSKAGGASTVMCAAYRPQDFRVTIGASVRLLMDVGDWDASLFVNAPGQSGDSRSPHYRDLAPLWAAGEYVPLAYSAAAVDDATESVIELRPEGDAA
ncbi:MAG: penicillin acylase family protein [Pseudomonadota bacterium]|nr:penicillin acylase family protein [Pseudomonadota bacterium]